MPRLYPERATAARLPGILEIPRSTAHAVIKKKKKKDVGNATPIPLLVLPEFGRLYTRRQVLQQIQARYFALNSFSLSAIF
jgi:hypothetical protein